MICKKCHVHMEDDALTCPVCGAVQEPEEAELTEQEPAPQEPVCEEADQEELVMEELDAQAEPEAVEEIDQQMEPLKPSKHKKWIRIGAIVCCVILVLGLGLGLWTYINGGLAPRKNDLYYKDNYTAESDDAALKEADKVVANVGDYELTNAQLQVFYWMEYYTFLENYNSYLSYLGLDITQPLSQQYTTDGGATWEQYFLDGALSKWHSYQSLLVAGEAEGFQMSELLYQQLDSIRLSMTETALNYDYDDADALVRDDMGANTDMDAYSKYLEIYYGGMEYFEQIYDQVNPTAEEIEAYYNEHADELLSTYNVDKESGKLIDVRHILVTVKGGTTDEEGNTTYSDEEWETCRQEAQSVLDKWLEGEATEVTFATLASQVTEDPGSASTGGLYTMVYEGQMVPAFDAWCFDEARQPGDYGLVQTNYGYHVMYFVYGDEGWIRYAQEDLIAAVCSDKMQQIMEAYPMEVNYKNITLASVDFGY